MPKPACAKCQRFFRPKKNGVLVLEQKPIGRELAPPGSESPNRWEPYKVWAADLWDCPGCGAEVTVGYSAAPVSQDYLEGFDSWVDKCTIVINDC